MQKKLFVLCISIKKLCNQNSDNLGNIKYRYNIRYSGKININI